MIDSAGMIGSVRSATRRTIMLVLVALSIFVNAATGAFAGTLHAHDHEHGQQHAHGHDDDHDHAPVPEPVATEFSTATTSDPNTPRPDHDTLHEHGATVVLALAHVSSMTDVSVRASPDIGPVRGTLSDLRIGLDRPPRCA